MLVSAAEALESTGTTGALKAGQKAPPGAFSLIKTAKFTRSY